MGRGWRGCRQHRLRFGIAPGPQGPQLYASLTDSPVLRRLNAGATFWENALPGGTGISNAQTMFTTSNRRLLLGSANSINALRRFDGAILDQLNNALQVIWSDANISPPQFFAPAGNVPELSGLFQSGRLISGDASLVSRWNGREWQTVGGTTLLGVAQQIAVHTSSNGDTALFAFGSGLRRTAADTTPGAVRYTPAGGWVPTLDALSGNFRRAVSLRINGNTELLVTGSNVRRASETTGGVLRWNGAGFDPIQPTFTGEVNDLIAFDSGSGESLHLAVNSLLIAGRSDRFVVRLENGQWTALDPLVLGRCQSLTIFDDGRGPTLFAAGFISANPANPAAVGTGVFRWSGTAWERLAAVSATPSTLRLAVYDDGGGEGLWLVGNYIAINALQRRGVSFYRGGFWWPTPLSTASGPTYAVTPAPGAEPTLYFAGVFSSMGSRTFQPTAEIRGCARRPCPADVDDGSGNGSPDGGVNVDDLTFFLDRYEIGDPAADLDDGTGRNVRDAAVTLDDLLYYLQRYSQGC